MSCPARVSQLNWEEERAGPEEFEVTTAGSSLQITRVDSGPGWDKEVSFLCCSPSTYSQGMPCPSTLDRRAAG